MIDKVGLTREAFPYQVAVPGRFADDDMLGHANNVVYHTYIQEVVVRFLIGPVAFEWRKSPILTYAAETLCRFHAPISYPEPIEGRLMIERLGTSSVTYGIGLFVEGRDVPAASGHFVHVFVDRETEKPVPIPADIRSVFEAYRPPEAGTGG
ncbi:MAG: acyl-CoA thioesterase [Magnetovibrionaceae bacterium]